MLGLSDRTVETHRLNIMGKLVPKNRAERVRYAIREDLLKAG
jgi:DNA-binding NarL/FixJ family response regulator